MQRIDIAAYDVRIEPAPSGGLFATVVDLPGCFAVADDATKLAEAVEQSILVYVQSHPEAPARSEGF